MKSPEYDLQCAIVEHLRKRGQPNVYWTAIPMGEKRSAITGARIKRMGGRAGAPDLFFVIKGIAHGLELKAGPGARTSGAQYASGKDWVEAGGQFAIAHGLDDALFVLESWGALKGRAA